MPTNWYFYFIRLKYDTRRKVHVETIKKRLCHQLVVIMCAIHCLGNTSFVTRILCSYLTFLELYFTSFENVLQADVVAHPSMCYRVLLQYTWPAVVYACWAVLCFLVYIWEILRCLRKYSISQYLVKMVKLHFYIYKYHCPHTYIQYIH